MTEADQFDSPEAGKPYPSPTLLPPLVRFFVAFVWTAAVYWCSGFVYELFPHRHLLPGLLFRLIACALTAAGFAFFLRVFDYNLSALPTALGLPFDFVASRQFTTGLALGAVLITADVLAIACFGSLQLHLHLARHMPLRAAAVALLLLFGALSEELSFRGYPFQKLTETFGAFWAVIALSALFGAVHLWNPDAQGVLSWGFFNTLGVGLLFALARIRTGSLWFSFGLHFGWNLFQGTVFGLPVSGIQEFTTLVVGTAHGSLALTGGAYGPEASATCTIVLVVALPLLWMLTSSRNIQHHPPSLTPTGSI